MTTGNVLYLAMAIGMFVVFALVLAYQSWQQSRLGSEAAPVSPAYRPEPRHGVTA
jgi:hypothetical protein